MHSNDYLIQHEEKLPHQKYDSHPILADYGTDRFSIRINDKGIDIIVKPLDSFSFKSITQFQNKYKTPAKKHNKSLHQQSLLLNNTDVTSADDDHINTRIPKFVTFSFTNQNNDTYQTPTLTRSNSSSTIIIQEPSSLSTSVFDTTEPNKLSTHTSQIIPFYDPSFFKHKNYFQGFFLPDDFSLELHTLQLQQTQDPVLKRVYHWIPQNTKPEYPTPLIHGSPFLHANYKIFSHFFIDDGTNLISVYTKIKSFSDTQSNTTPPLVYSKVRICLPFRLFKKKAFNKLHAHFHTGTKITYNTFSQYYYIPFLEKWLSIFIHDCLECERNKHFNMNINTAPLQSFSEHTPSFNYRISMDTKVLLLLLHRTNPIYTSLLMLSVTL